MKTAQDYTEKCMIFLLVKNIDADDVIDIHKYVMKKHNIE